MSGRIAAAWLALREPADAAARAGAWSALAGPLREDLARRPGPLHVIDVGAGTGANRRWLGPRLAALLPGRDVEWTLLDHDADLLRGTEPGPGVVVRVGDLADVAALVDDRATLVTASALLDVLTAAQLDALVGPVARHGASFLAALTIGPGWWLEAARPGEAGPDAGDVEEPDAAGDEATTAAIDRAFHNHQARGGWLGCRAVDRARAGLERAGRTVVTAATPWRLGPGDAALVDRFLAERVDAAIEADPSLDGPARAWLARHRAEAARGRLRVVVEHTDLLAVGGVGAGPA